ncbi:MAG: SDR family oxidoreductase [Deltaproteobacteria bacterium]|nr:SDR family oxidoreductase [Deltaproteobacteria bacterium]
MSGEVALVTGASRGIGLACARALLREGARLALVARDVIELGAAAAQLRQEGAAVLALAGDVSDESFVATAFEQAEQELGPVAVVVNNAGVLEIAPVAELTSEAWDRTLDVNLKGAFLCAREAVRRMVPRGKGRVVFVSSISATLGTSRLAAYCASKWGMHGLIKSLAEELRGTGVIALGVAPGSVDTAMLARSGFPPAMQPEDVAVVVRFLSTDAPAAMQGSIVEIFG